MSRMLTGLAATAVAASSFFRRDLHHSPIIRGLVQSSSLPRPKRVLLREAGRAVHLLVLLSLLITTFIPASTGAAAAVGGASDPSGPAARSTSDPRSSAPGRAGEYSPPRFERPEPRLGELQPRTAAAPNPQSEGDRVWAGTSNAGVWQFQAGTWTQRSGGLGNVEVRSLAVNPFDHDVLLAVTPGGVFRTADAGLSWTQLSMPYTQAGWDTVFWNRTAPGEVVISGPDLGEVFDTDPRAAVSYDGGLSWIGHDLPLNADPDGDPRTAEARPGDVWGFAGVWYMMGNSFHNIVLGWPCHRHAFWRSSDFGRTWDFKCSWPRKYWDVDRHVTGLWSDPGHVFGTFDHTFDNPIIESTDFADRWSPGTQFLNTQRNIQADPVRDFTLWLVAERQLYRSTDGSSAFELITTGMGGVRVAAVDGYRGAIYAAGSDRRMAYSEDEAVTWTRADLPLGDPVESNTHIISLVAEQPPVLELPERSALSFGGPKNGQHDPRECQVECTSATQGWPGDPINSRSGALSYAWVDLEVPTAALPLTFERTYSSQATDLYSAPLGAGWTHNHDTRLIFPDDPLGEPGVVWFKSHSANEYRFFIRPGDDYIPDFGVLAELTRDAGPPVRYALTTPNQATYTFDEGGNLLTWSDAQGRTFSHSYDASGRLARISGPSGSRHLEFSYDGQDRITAVSDHSGREVTFTYDAAGDLVAAIDALGGTWAYAYDADHRLLSVTDPRGVVTLRTEYDAEGRAVRQFNGKAELLAELTYNPDGSTTVVDGLGHSQVHTYDDRNTLTDRTDALGGSNSKGYARSFRPESLTDPAGDSTQLDWSGDGANLLQVVDAEGEQTDLDYDELNNLTSVVEPRGFLTSYEYDGTLLTRATDALGNVTDPLGRTTSYTYDAFGQRTSMTDPLGNTWSYSYDDLGRLVETEDTIGRVTQSEYDAQGRLVRAVRNHDPARPQNDEGQYNIVTEYEYDAVGNLVRQVDTLGRVTS